MNNAKVILKILKAVIFILAVSLLAVCIFKLYNYYSQLSQSTEQTQILAEKAVEVTEKEKAPIEVDFEKLKKENDDIIAWIYAENTPLNNPIVQAEDNDYYLRRFINGKYNIAGTLFADFRNASDFSDLNTVIYGHNMNNGSMFGFILNYRKQEYYDAHKTAYLLTPEKKFRIDFVAGMTVKADDEIYKFPMTYEDRKNLISRTEKNSDFVSEKKISEEDKLITLSTCSYSFKNARYVLVGALKEL